MEIISNPGAERTILANCLNNPNTIIQCEAEGLMPKHFGIKANVIIYTAIVYLFTQNATIDPVSIQNVIRDPKAQKTLEDIGGLEYLMLLQQSPQSQNINMFVQQVMQCYVRRMIYNTSAQLQKDVLNDEQSTIEELLGKTQQSITQITLETTKVAEAYKMGDKIDERLQEKANNPNEVPGLPTGWVTLDKLTKGGQPGDLIIVCAESKTGKSVTLMNWAKYAAIDLGQPILYIDAEQSDEEEEFRLLSIVSQIPEDELTTGLFMRDTGYGTAKEKIERIKKAKTLIKNSKFYHVSMPEFTLEKIQAITRQFYLKHGIVALYFDYIDFNPTLLAQNKHMRDDMILTNLAVGLKNLGHDLGIPVFTAAQENRTGYGATEKDAKNIGGSIGILQKATKLLFLRNKNEEELALQGANRGNQKLLLKYQRHGEMGKEIDIFFDRIRITQHEC